MSEQSIFIEALEEQDPAQRAALLEQACAGNPDLRQRVERLLGRHHDAGSFLEFPGVGVASGQPSPVEGPGSVIGPYRLLQKIGEGGMGVIFMAEQTRPVQRKVALKIIQPGMDTRQVIARFEAERQALALMDHPNIAKVLDAGTTDSGKPFFVMELVKGVLITQYCDEHHLTLRERLELFVPVCKAVQHAHQKGIIHRDLKASNVLIALYDGQPVPKVIDFGVAKATGAKLTERTLFTEFGQVVGTLEYMSPEQAELNQLDIDTRSDIYSLGVLLYELLTGTTPLERGRLKDVAFLEVLRLVREEEPLKPSTRLNTTEGLPSIAAKRGLEPLKLNRLVRGELDWIVMKALDKDRNRRYETANGLAMDVQRYLDDEPVQACPPSAAYRFWKFARRHKAALWTATAVVLAVLLAVAGLVLSTVRIATALKAETLAHDDLQETLERERRDSYFHRITLAHRELSADNLGRALELLAECPKDLREWEWHYLMRLCRVEPVIIRDKTEINCVAFSPDGERLAFAGGDGLVKIVSSRTGQVIQTLTAHGSFVCSVAFHPDGKHLASVGAEKQVKVWDLTTGLSVFTEPCDAVHLYGTAYAVAFSPDGQSVAAGNDGSVMVWDWKSHQLRCSFGGHTKRPICVAFSRDGRRLASGSWQGRVQLSDVEAGGEARLVFAETRDSRHPVCAMAFSTDGGRLATASFNRRVDVWDTTTGGLIRSLPHNGLVQCVAFSPDGRRIASAGEEKIVRIWDATTGREVLGLRGHTSHCGCVTFSPDGRRLASASMDGTIRVWDATELEGHEGQEMLTFQEHTNEIWSLAVSPDGQQVVSAGFSTPAKVWDPRTGHTSIEFREQADVVFCVAWQPDGRRIASAGAEGGLFTVRVWDPLTGHEVFALPGARPGDSEFFAVAFSPDGRYLVTGRTNGKVQVWDARTGDEISVLCAHERAMRGVVFSRDGRHLASSSADGLVKLWDATRLDQKQEEARLTLHARLLGPCLNIAFSPDGRRLATAGEENTVKIWDVQTGEELLTLRGHHGDIYTVAFSHDPDGRWIASAGEDSIVHVWDSHAGGAPVRSFRGHTGLVSSVAFSSDGKRLISGSRDHTAKVWDVTQLNELSEKP